MEQSLKQGEEQEQKYSAELAAALNEYTWLRDQAQSFDPVQFYEARQAIHPNKEQKAESRAQEVYGEKYNPLLMFDSKKEVPVCCMRIWSGRHKKSNRFLIRRTGKRQNGKQSWKC